ncbi:hypothetical protein GMA8713_05156 [Grimontia marina]|uniref:Uncharacterized protein n=1 Tax=Grimontia marina TaxID=646534 RepID=A0A128FKM0_9GAMM|nr:hypothetical protein GMA8713_05156 [Grimontia marina]
MIQGGRITAVGGVARRVGDGGRHGQGRAGGWRGHGDRHAVIQHGLGHGAVKQCIAILVGDHQGIAHRGACTEGDGDVDVTIELIAIDVAVVVGILINDHRWRRRCAAACAVIQGGRVRALSAVARRISDRGGDVQLGAGRRGGHRQVKAIVQHVLGDRAFVQGVARVIGDHNGVTHGGTGAQGDGDIHLAAELAIVDVTIIVGIFGNLDGRRSRCAGALAVIQGGGVTAGGSVATGVGHGSRQGQAGASGWRGQRQRQAIVQHVLGNGGAVHLIAILVGDNDGVTHFGAFTQRHAVVDVAIQLVVIDVAIIVGIFINGQGRRAQIRVAATGIQYRTVTAIGGVARRIGDGGGDHQIGATGWCINRQVKAIVQHVLRHRTGEDDRAILVGDHKGVAHGGAAGQGHGDVHLTHQFGIIDVAVVVGIFGDGDHRRARRRAADIQYRAV